MAKKNELETQIMEHANELRGQHGLRNQMFEEIEAAYFMEYGGRRLDKFSQITVSPDPRNAVRGMVSLVVAADPVFNLVEFEGMNPDIVERLEKAINRAWDAAGKVSGIPVHFDMVESAALYSEIHTAVTLTREMVEAARRSGDEAHLKRMERLYRKTPFIFSSWNPKTGYPEFDTLGQMSAYYHEIETTGRELAARFGAGAKNLDRYKPYTLSEFWDDQYYMAWVEGLTLVAPMEHGYPVIPISGALTEGSKLFTKPEQNREPLLYGVIKGKWWNWQNAIYTTVMTAVFQMGLTPVFKHTRSQTNPGKLLEINFEDLPGVAELDPGETLEVMQTKGIIDPAVAQALGLIEQKIEQSTIYRQAMGAPLGGDQPFSSLALLSQSGRLPLVNTQRRGGWSIGSVVETALELFRHDSQKYDQNGITINPEDIPDGVSVDVRLDVKLPQDKLQQANIAAILSKERLVSREWIQTNVLGIAQPKEMQEQVWQEQAEEVMYGGMLQSLIAQMQQIQQMQQAQMMGGGAPGGMPGMGGGETPPGPEGPEQMIAGAGQVGEPMQGGLPGEQAGMVPGQGQGTVPRGGF